MTKEDLQNWVSQNATSNREGSELSEKIGHMMKALP